LNQALQPEHHSVVRGVFLMFLRILLVLLKSSVMVTMFEFLSPIADAMGLQLNFIARIAGAISHATTLPKRGSEIVVVFLLSATLLEISKVFWDLITTRASELKLPTTLKTLSLGTNTVTGGALDKRYRSTARS
jgi:hypothetical protein